MLLKLQECIDGFWCTHRFRRFLEWHSLEYSKDLIVNEEAVRFVSKWSYKIIYERTSNEVIIIDVFGSYQSPNKLLTIFKKK